MNKQPVIKDYLFRIWYFRPSGRYFEGISLSLTCESINRDGTGGPNIYHAIKHFMDMKPLPGLNVGVWWGPIVISSDEGYPILMQNSNHRF